MSTLTATPQTRFASPDDRTAAEPAEYRALMRDEVRLLVTTESGVAHALFRDLPRFLRPGDLLVANDSATIPAEVDARGRAAGPLVVHVAGELDEGTWVVELRSAPDAAGPVLDAEPGQVVELPDMSTLTLLRPYPRPSSSPTGVGNRLWRARASGPPLVEVLARHGRPIAYGYLGRRYPLEDYQSVFSRRPGSAEMASAGRPFTHELVTRLVSSGVGVATVTLHTGVSSQDAGEAPQAERFEVPPATARAVNASRAAGGRVIAVGTTVTRALETVAGPTGVVRAASGWTEHVVSPRDPVSVVDGLITGWHNPDASHLLLVESVAGPRQTQMAYTAAVEEGYLWHEFGDSGLFLPSAGVGT